VGNQAALKPQSFLLGWLYILTVFNFSGELTVVGDEANEWLKNKLGKSC
jgi:hypothetical protein